MVGAAKDGSDFVDHLRPILNPRIPVGERDVHISEGTFAARAVEIIDTMIRKNPIRPDPGEEVFE
jgi:hypothetical protein